ncbi:MAG TPA: hypothetical protein VHV55_01885 [Pirellulales bacterium]|nr:hypothetical protein [Pirellulales bacterium]
MKPEEMPMTFIASSTQDALKDNTELLVQLHIAEYQALTTRCTYWITLQFSLWPILLLYLALIVQLWTSIPHEIVLWGSLAVAEFIVLIYYQLNGEHYHCIVYIEEHVRPLIESLIGQRRFWEYEGYLNRARCGKAAWYELAPAIIVAVCVVALTLFRMGAWSFGDLVGLLLCGPFAGCLVYQSKVVVQLRSRFVGPLVATPGSAGSNHEDALPLSADNPAAHRSSRPGADCDDDL